MKIALAQTRSKSGDIQYNINHHKKFIDSAIASGAGLVMFPELSLTNYEPELAQELAIEPDDVILDEFQTISDTGHIAIAAGAPVRTATGICISMLIFQPQQPRQIYSKHYLHADEEAFFVSGQNLPGLNIQQTPLALAICYEISVPEHTQQAFSNGAEIYIASVAKFVNGIDKSMNRLAEIARQYSSIVLMCNCVGIADGDECAGNTAVWDHQGRLIGQLDRHNEGILTVDTDTQTLIAKNL